MKAANAPRQTRLQLPAAHKKRRYGPSSRPSLPERCVRRPVPDVPHPPPVVRHLSARRLHVRCFVNRRFVIGRFCSRCFLAFFGGPASARRRQIDAVQRQDAADVQMAVVGEIDVERFDFHPNVFRRCYSIERNRDFDGNAVFKRRYRQRPFSSAGIARQQKTSFDGRLTACHLDADVGRKFERIPVRRPQRRSTQSDAFVNVETKTGLLCIHVANLPFPA